MEYWWKENKKYAMTVGGGLFAVLLWYMFLIGPANKATDLTLQKRQGEENKLRSAMNAGVPAEDSVARAKSDRTALAKELKTVQADTEFKLEESFKGDTAAILQRQVQIVKDFLAEAGRKKTFPPFDPKLGFTSFGAVQGNEDGSYAREWMRRLAIVKKVCLLAIEHMEKIEQIQAVPGMENQEEVQIRADRFFNKLQVKFKMQGTGDGLTRFLHGIQQKGSFLALDSFRCGLVDASRDLLTVDVTLSGIFLNPDSAIEPEEKK